MLVAAVLSGSRGASLKFQLIPVGGFPLLRAAPQPRETRVMSHPDFRDLNCKTSRNPGYFPVVVLLLSSSGFAASGFLSLSC
ncbi:hypothetical protein F4555_001505 [Mobiluncus mulieris]|uniref:Uncharacterized protein n=1 Tax=Mobiluncus mulieris TaxID=2052 RepID=A0A8G2M5X8_9ACTO|nr:hypothetical protein [Mobiluncus mulieris]STO16820.1 Uncharacterised protein [Mobiluncus mulieris]